ncbi:hypothetical protein [Dysgonomonas sp. 511]|uniref:hypothetical protein n=1 Tax=Dysgonomonas sp. 511 TaxID=2302930 RepID=UPI0013D1BCF0|nr:hypothetical protein [Dysgonomonas sp. 511]NDV77654.1 hypothetical protein [Dysgonomonas sp. 511]
MKNNQTSPLDELRLEKEIVKRQCEESEDRLAEHWDYLTDNAGSLIFNGLLGGIFGKRGGRASSSGQEKRVSSSGIMSNIAPGIFSGLSSFAPVVWDIVQPMLWGYAIKKVKSIFSSKKKK